MPPNRPVVQRLGKKEDCMRNQRSQSKIATLVVAVVAAAAALVADVAPRAAHAGEESRIAVDWPIRLVDRPLVLGPSMFEVRGDTLRLELSKDRVGDPFSLAPDLYYGLSKGVTLGYFHNVGLCISGDSCDFRYSDAGAEALFSLISDGAVVVAGRAGVTVERFLYIPGLPNARPPDSGYFQTHGGVHAGLAVRVTAGDVAVLAEPRLYVALLERYTYPHEDFVDVPVQLQYQLTDQNALLLTSGMRGPLSDFGDSFAVPVGLGALVTLSRRVDVGGEFLFTNLAGRGGGVDGRLLLLRVAVRL
jgi:hypothetical protein